MAEDAPVGDRPSFDGVERDGLVDDIHLVTGVVEGERCARPHLGNAHGAIVGGIVRRPICIARQRRGQRGDRGSRGLIGYIDAQHVERFVVKQAPELTGLGWFTTAKAARLSSVERLHIERTANCICREVHQNLVTFTRRHDQTGNGHRRIHQTAVRRDDMECPVVAEPQVVPTFDLGIQDAEPHELGGQADRRVQGAIRQHVVAVNLVRDDRVRGQKGAAGQHQRNVVYAIGSRQRQRSLLRVFDDDQSACAVI